MYASKPHSKVALYKKQKRGTALPASLKAIQRMAFDAPSMGGAVGGKKRGHRRRTSLGGTGSVFTRDMGGVRARDRDNKVSQHCQEIYYFGIIDVLQKYNLKKGLETHLKGLVHDKKKISAVPPDMYADRFYKFMVDIVDHDQLSGGGIPPEDIPGSL